MKLKNENIKKGLTNRLKRIEGQLRGVQTMIEEERECHEVLQQCSAIRAAMRGVMQSLLQEYASCCLLKIEETDEAQRKQLLDDMIELVSKSI